MKLPLMKQTIVLLSVALLLVGCAAVTVTETRVATGARQPQAIYIRPFAVGDVCGRWGSAEEWPLRASLAGEQFADALKEELEKIAPCRVLREGEIPELGWLVEGDLAFVHGGSPALRAGPLGWARSGRSQVVIDVRVKEIASTRPRGCRCRLAYDFTLAGGSSHSSLAGSIYAPGLGQAPPFDFRNAAERVYMVLSTDPHRYGMRTSPVIR